MTRPVWDSGRRARVAAVCWIVVAVVAWNVVYELIVARGIKEYLRRHAMWEAGRGPLVSIAEVLDPTVVDAAWKATLFASLVLLAGLLTIRLVGGERQP